MKNYTKMLIDGTGVKRVKIHKDDAPPVEKDEPIPDTSDMSDDYNETDDTEAKLRGIVSSLNKDEMSMLCKMLEKELATKE